MAQNKNPKSREKLASVRSKEKVFDALVQLVTEQESVEVETTFDNLHKMTGLAVNTIVLAIKGLILDEKIVKVPSLTRRYPNRYIVNTDVTLVSRPKIEKGKVGDLIGMLKDMRAELKELKEENITLKETLGHDNAQIISKNQTGDLVMVLYKINEQEDTKENTESKEAKDSNEQKISGTKEEKNINPDPVDPISFSEVSATNDKIKKLNSHD